MSEWDLKETLLDKEDVFNGTLLHVERWRAQLPNGAIATREMIRHVGASAIVPVDEEGNVYLVRQYRAPIARAERPAFPAAGAGFVPIDPPGRAGFSAARKSGENGGAPFLPLHGFAAAMRRVLRAECKTLSLASFLLQALAPACRPFVRRKITSIAWHGYGCL